MEKAKKDLTIFSKLFICLGALDLISIVTNYFMGVYDPKNVPDVSLDVAKAIMITAIVIAVIASLVKFYLGFKGLNQAKGTGKGTSHITISKILLVFFVIIFAVGAYGLIKDSSTWLSVLSDLASIIILFTYISSATKLKEGK